jgi:hypothetical protein
MKKALLLSVIFSLFMFLPLTSQNQGDDLSALKKQVTVLKNKNAQLEKSVKEIKRTSNALADTLAAKIEAAENQIKATSDTLQTKEKIITNLRKNTLVLFNALKHRKKLVIIAIIIVVFIVAGVSFYIGKKYQADRKKNEDMLMDMKNKLANDLNSSKTELQSQLNSVTSRLEEKNKELEQKIKDQEKKINEMKK